MPVGGICWIRNDLFNKRADRPLIKIRRWALRYRAARLGKQHPAADEHHHLGVSARLLNKSFLIQQMPPTGI